MEWFSGPLLASKLPDMDDETPPIWNPDGKGLRGAAQDRMFPILDPARSEPVTTGDDPTNGLIQPGVGEPGTSNNDPGNSGSGGSSITMRAIQVVSGVPAAATVTVSTP